MKWVWLLAAIPCSAEVLPFMADTNYACDTYPWYLQNTQQVLAMFQNGVRAANLDAPSGSATSRIIEAWRFQDNADGITVGIVSTDPMERAAADWMVQTVCNGRVTTVDCYDFQAALMQGVQVICFYQGWYQEMPNWWFSLKDAAAANILVVSAAPDTDATYDGFTCKEGVTSQPCPDGKNWCWVTNLYCVTNVDYPARWHFPNVLIVNGHTISGAPIFSHSTNDFDICGPAHRMQATVDRYGNGNSLTVNIVAGVAALLKAEFPWMTAIQMKRRIETTVAVSEAYATHCRTSGTLDAAATLASTNVAFEIQGADQIQGPWHHVSSAAIKIPFGGENFVRLVP